MLGVHGSGRSEAITRVDYHPPAADIAVRFGPTVPEGLAGSLRSSPLFTRVEDQAEYLNLWLSDAAFETWPRRDLPLSGLRVAVEHTSMTPYIPINIATARSTVVGEQLRRSAETLGATATGHFWFEDAAKQRDLVRLLTSARISDHGKADHVIGVIYCAGKARQRELGAEWLQGIVRSMFEADDGAVALFDPAGDPPSLAHDASIVIGYRKTLAGLGARNVVFDRWSELWASTDVNSIVNQLSEVASPSALDAVTELREGRSPYSVRNFLYYRHLLLNHEFVYSVAPQRQRPVVSIAQELVADERLAIHFYGDVLVDGARDSLRGGVFHPADGLFAESAAQVGGLRRAILGRAPLVPLELASIVTPAREPAMLKVPANRQRATVLLLDGLNQILGHSLRTARFANLMSWQRTARRVVAQDGTSSADVTDLRAVLEHLEG